MTSGGDPINPILTTLPHHSQINNTHRNTTLKPTNNLCAYTSKKREEKKRRKKTKMYISDNTYLNLTNRSYLT